MSTSQTMPMQVNNINPVCVPTIDFVFLYQVDPNTENFKSEQLILVNKQSNWQLTMPVSRVMPKGNWVVMKFKDIPESGNFDLLQDPNDGQPAYYIFDNVPYSELNNQTPTTAPMPEITEE